MYNFDDLGKKISEINERIDALIAKTGLSYSEFAVLYTIAKDGRSTQKKISEEWLIPKQTIFNVCKDFRQKELVQPSEQSVDKRERAMSLTQKGRDAADPIVRASDELGERVFVRLGEKTPRSYFRCWSAFARFATTRSKTRLISRPKFKFTDFKFFYALLNSAKSRLNLVNFLPQSADLAVKRAKFIQSAAVI